MNNFTQVTLETPGQEHLEAQSQSWCLTWKVAAGRLEMATYWRLFWRV